MRAFPIIPIWLMLIICVGLIIFCRKDLNNILIIILLFIINLRVMIVNNNSEVLTNNLDVLFVVDDTISMTALDYNGGSRLDALKEDCYHIVDSLNGANFAIISFDNNARIQIPFTNDINTVKSSLKSISTISELYAKGSTLNVSLDLMDEYLSSTKKDDRTKILFYISDGEITNESKLESFSKIRKYISGGAVLGYGTSEGGKMLVYDKYADKTEYLTYYDRKLHKEVDALSVIDEKNLKKIASDIGIDYIHMKKQSDVDSLLKSIKNGTSYSLKNEDKSSYDDIYFIFVVPLLFLLFLELNKYRRIIL